MGFESYHSRGIQACRTLPSKNCTPVQKKSILFGIPLNEDSIDRVYELTYKRRHLCMSI